MKKHHNKYIIYNDCFQKKFKPADFDGFRIVKSISLLRPHYRNNHNVDRENMLHIY